MVWIALARTITVLASAPVLGAHLQLAGLDRVRKLATLFGRQEGVQLRSFFEMTPGFVGATRLHRGRESLHVGSSKTLTAKGLRQFSARGSHSFVLLGEFAPVIFDGAFELLALSVGALDHGTQFVDPMFGVFGVFGVVWSVMLGMSGSFGGKVLGALDLCSGVD